MKEYAYYYGDEYIMCGTLEQIAKHLGIKKQTVTFYTSKAARERNNRNVVLALEEEQTPVDADIDKLKRLTKKHQLNWALLSEWADIPYHIMLSKKDGKGQFTDDEVERLEKVFRLDEGALLK